jgi:hypothetical protein
MQRETRMNRKLNLLSVMRFASGLVIMAGWVTASRADEITKIEMGVSDLRDEIASLFAPGFLDRGLSWMVSQPHSPTLDLLGSYFPAWMLCAVVGIVATVVIRQVLMIVGVGEYVIAPLLTYFGLALSATWVMWLVMFGH